MPVIFHRRNRNPAEGFAAGNQEPRRRGLFLALSGKSDSSADEVERNKGDDWTRRKPQQRRKSK